MTPSRERQLAVFVCALLLAWSGDRCSHAQPPAEANAAVDGIEFFEKRIRPLLIEHCYECHSAEEKSGGLLLDYKDGLLIGGDSGAALVPGDPAASRIIEAVRFNNLDLQMPPDGRLSDADVSALEKWIGMGAPDPRAAPATSRPATASGMSVEDGRNFWSFRPVVEAALPQVSDNNWVQTPVDAFILSKLDQAGLKPAPPADKRTLIRRVTFDLIGLPPTAEEVDDFLADEHPDAYRQLVERLLNSPHYGERWGRHWLDVARYSDSNGLDENLAFGNAWRYRDYVVAAFNEDKPFDQFLIEQLAGDLLPNATLDNKTATAFLALGAKVLAEPDREKLVMDTVDEQIDATGKAFLGLALGCARCHDHKFDPILQSDYYSLAAFFKSTRTFANSNTGAIKHWFEHSFATADEEEQIKQIDAEIAAKNSAATKYKNEALERLRKNAIADAAKYLAACSEFSPAAPFSQVETIAARLQLHPRILHHCRQHLEVRRDDLLVAEWHGLLESQPSSDAIEEHFQQLFAAATAKPEDRKPDDAKQAEAKPDGDKPTEAAAEPAAPDPRLTAAAAALEDRSGFLAIPPQPKFALDAESLAHYYDLLEQARLLESAAPDTAAAMGVSEGKVLVKLPIHIRGSHNNLGQPVEREFPQVMRYSSVRPVLPRNQSGRLELARWMASSQHPLTARVYVNRIWRWHFGRGLVASTENFGALGDRPTHPELLDWLAFYLMESGWSTKDMHRLLLTSSAYQMSSTNPLEDQVRDVDPDNQLLWKFRIQRLEAEQIRDAILAVAGQLDQSMGGKTVPLRNRQFVFNHTSVDHTQYDSHRRAIYLPVIRNNLYTLFEQFDFPDPTTPTGDRSETVVAPQALLMLNDPLVMDAADALAAQALGSFSQNPQRVAFAYEQSLGRVPVKEEIDQALEFIAQAAAAISQLTPDDTQAAKAQVETGDPAAAKTQLVSSKNESLAAWSLFCQSLLASSEFFYVR